MSLPAISLGFRFCTSRKGMSGGGGWAHPKGANSMAISIGRAWLALDGPFLTSFV